MFTFKQFHIYDGSSPLKVGTDGVLIGAWTSVVGLNATDSIIDVGAGCGVVALMLAQRCEAQISAVEISAEACSDCVRNFAASPWAGRLQCVCTDFLTYEPAVAPTLIVSNPPFFSTGERAAGERATARHDDTLPMSSLIDKAASLLAPGGRLALIAPADREDDIVFHGAMAGLQTSRLCRVHTTVVSTPRRILVELIKGVHTSYEESSLTIRDANGNYTREYTNLVKDFYIKL